MSISITRKRIASTVALAGITLIVCGQTDTPPGMRGGDAPPNDECTGATTEALAIGGTRTFVGDNTGANVLEGTPFVVVWEAFTLDDCATVRIDHCLEGFPYESFLNTITNACPNIDEGMVTAAEIEECHMIFPELAPGTWYIPVLVDEELTPVGEYSFSVTALECNPPYCTAWGGSQEHTGGIMGVSIGGMEYMEASPGMGYVDNTLGDEIFLGTDQDYEIQISLDDSELEGGVAGTGQILVWIDLDQNGDFTDPGELVYISADPLEGTEHTGVISVPNTAVLGTTRMRIRLHDRHDGTEYENEPNNTPCDNSTFGQVQDFTVNVDLGTSVQEHAEDRLLLYPNPSAGEITLTPFDLNGAATVLVMDLSGRAVHQARVVLNDQTPLRLDLRSKVKAGGYVLQVVQGEERHMRPIMIQ